MLSEWIVGWLPRSRCKVPNRRKAEAGAAVCGTAGFEMSGVGVKRVTGLGCVAAMVPAASHLLVARLLVAALPAAVWVPAGRRRAGR